MFPDNATDPINGGTQYAPDLSVIIAARNESAWLPRSLNALLAQDVRARKVEIVIAANGCTDDTVDIARGFGAQVQARGWQLQVLELGPVGKLGALEAADAAAQSDKRAYLDADVICDPALLGLVIEALDTDVPRYATGTLSVAPAETAVTRAYARIWIRLPFVESGAVGAGFFAVNAAGRARWADWPGIISDDTFVRLHFSPDERIEVPAPYHWPMVEGFSNLVRVRRRQNAGVDEIARLYPEILQNEVKAAMTFGRIMHLSVTDPVGMGVYCAVHAAVCARSASDDWTRGR